MEKEQKNLREIINYRLEKLEKIRAAGFNPYPYNFDKTHQITELLKKGDNGVGEKVKTAGRMVSFRKMGKASFTHIQDEGGKIQLTRTIDIAETCDYQRQVIDLIRVGLSQHICTRF